MPHDLRTSEIIYQELVRGKSQFRVGWGKLTAPLLGIVLVLPAACGGRAAAVASPSASPSAAPSVAPSPSPSLAPTASETLAPPTAAPTPTPPSRALRDLGPGETLRLLSEFHIPRSGFAVSMAFSPVQPVLYHAGVGREIQGYDFEAEQMVFQIQGFQDAPLVLAVSASGDRIVAEDGPALGIWDLSTSERIGSLQMPAIFTPLNAGFVAAEAFFADDESGNLALWETARWEEVARLAYLGRSDGGFVLPRGEAVVMLIRGREELSLVDWSGQLIRAIPLGAQPWRLHGISPQGERALLHVDVGLGSEGVLITDLAGGGTAIRFPLLNIRAIAVSADWRTLAIADAAELLRLFDPSTGEPFFTQPLDAFQIRGLTVSPDGALLGVYLRREGEEGGWIQIWGRDLP